MSRSWLCREDHERHMNAWWLARRWVLLILVKWKCRNECLMVCFVLVNGWVHEWMHSPHFLFLRAHETLFYLVLQLLTENAGMKTWFMIFGWEYMDICMGFNFHLLFSSLTFRIDRFLGYRWIQLTSKLRSSKQGMLQILKLMLKSGALLTFPFKTF